ncbi:hypothetical protein J2Z69_002726 [Paenibacillus shirakamiensis]|uniref:Aspartyl-phosphate phosphatase Spo0E family protein n=1 Tax=Paenibacillus shirakamiensis TaxID=1265935 RepID=A0ABS4JIZ8_9BACL|nr:aspartyl-phosphate phosphatase Spo0E family protein [Paenibacillus shirakamiensis]MBP2001681.1 hypothetical protein [Paenibacillus shirakamiensis]
MALNPIQTHRKLKKGTSKVNEDLLSTIENLRLELILAAADWNFTSDYVLELSQRLDRYIILAQHQMIGGFQALDS